MSHNWALLMPHCTLVLQGWDVELDPAGGQGSRRSSIDVSPRSGRPSLDSRSSVSSLRRHSFTGEGARPHHFRPSIDSALSK